jgi:hypothetical protein
MNSMMSDMCGVCVIGRLVSYVRNAMYALRVGVSNPVCTGPLWVELRYGRDQTSAAEQFKSNKRISSCGSLRTKKPFRGAHAVPVVCVDPR